MPVFDSLEFRYTCMKNKRCSWWVRTGFRLFIGGLAFFVAVAFPFLPRNRVTPYTGLSMFHVDFDQETPSKGPWCHVVS
ncbi:hypothetical protein NC652_033988 [Populus alba x Populus x berolinensis]|uniref:Transmembrane protein n=1 Tax=Populus alba x Populus x berolinensis TaxID=444605 RepID=A0AAD6LUT1_9ROSI|nr:hypothetical protein NC652_033988 [Populus alba x Populus x berolinensis]KAJ6973693.1 hypothetical protein NC653_033894 [Populus alba x Populus x berolinensis]